MTAPDLDALEKRLCDAADDFANHATPIEGDGQTATLLREAADMIAELKEARALLEILDAHLGEDDSLWMDDSTVSGEWIGSDGIRRSLTFGMFRRIRAFLARNGKGEGK